MGIGRIDRPAVSRRMLATGDAGALLAFVLLGLRSHQASSTPAAVARTAVPVLVSWFVLGAVTGAYRRPGARTLFTTWATAIPIAVAARTLILGHPTGTALLIFLAVMLAVTGALLLLWRLVAAAPWWSRRRGDPARDGIASA